MHERIHVRRVLLLVLHFECVLACVTDRMASVVFLSFLLLGLIATIIPTATAADAVADAKVTSHFFSGVLSMSCHT